MTMDDLDTMRTSAAGRFNGFAAVYRPADAARLSNKHMTDEDAEDSRKKRAKLSTFQTTATVAEHFKKADTSLIKTTSVTQVSPVVT